MKLMAEARGMAARSARYGVEIEMENAAHVRGADGWLVETDGSLRNDGREFVFDGAADYETSVERLDAAGIAIRDADVTPVHNARTSVHIHIDVTGMTPDEFVSFIKVYTCVEPTLFKLFGAGREYSPYCVPLHQARDYTHMLLRAERYSTHDASMLLRNYKYTALSCNRFHDFGTMEMRLFNGSNDADTLIQYLDVAHMLRHGVGVEDMLLWLDCAEDIPSALAIGELLDFEEAASFVSQGGYTSVGSEALARLYRRAGCNVRVRNQQEAGVTGTTTARYRWVVGPNPYGATDLDEE